jgi:hypothetical protein
MTLRESVDFLKLTNARLIGQVLDLTYDANRSPTLLDAAAEIATDPNVNSIACEF